VDLEEWLANIDDADVVDYCFPTDELRAQYLTSIHARTEPEVRGLLREHFLMPTGTLGADQLAAAFAKSVIQKDPSELQRYAGIEHYRRLLELDGEEPTWQGLSWVLDLLPHAPLLAIEAIDAYLVAQAVFMPDGRISGLGDAQAVIRAM
jgi:restriction system protein